MEDYTNSTGQNTGQTSERPAGGPTGQNLGIAALITAIVTFVLSVIPCIGLIAMIPGIIAIILAAVGLSQASRNNYPRGILIAGLIIAIVAVFISFSQIFIAGRIGDRFEKEFGGRIETVIDDVQENVLDELEDANVSIKVQNGDDKVEITVDAGKKNRIEELEELENENAGINDTLEKKE